MNAPALYDLSPAVRMMIMGAVIALGPLALSLIHISEPTRPY